MTLSHLMPILRDDPTLEPLLSGIGRAQGRVAVADLPASARPMVAAIALNEGARPGLVVTARADRAEAFAAALREYLPQEREPIVWPAPEALPYEQLPFDLNKATLR